MGKHLTIHNVQTEDAGIYYCFAKTNSGHTVGIFHLTVLRENEAIIQAPKNVTRQVGESGYFTCQSNGKLLLEQTSWVKLESNEEDEGFIVLSEGSEVLEIENITFADEGFYACVVGNNVANVQAGAYLTVEDPTIIHISPQDQNSYVIVSIKTP